MDWKCWVNKKKSSAGVINLRRSIRDYADTPVSEEDLHTILEAARQAPSGENYQPWRLLSSGTRQTRIFCPWSEKAQAAAASPATS
jgi:hypothetical protein